MIEWTRPDEGQFDILQPGAEAEDGNIVDAPDHGLQVCSPDGGGLCVYGPLGEIKDFLNLMVRAVDLEIQRQNAGTVVEDLPVSVRPTWLDGKGF